MKFLKNPAVLAEFFAMTLFVFVGCGAAVASQAMLGFNPEDTRSNTFLLAVSVAFGFGISVLAYGIAPISGGHINPAVTFALYILGEIETATAAAYVTAQFLGAVLGAAIVWGSMVSDSLSLATDADSDSAPPFLLGSNAVAEDYSLGSAFLIEAMGTFLLVWTVLLTAVSKNSIAGNLAPIAIGWSVLLAHIILIPFTGCGINPARSFGPHLVIVMAGYKAGTEGWWVYYTAPFVGAAVAAVVCKYVFGVCNDEDAEGDEDSPQAESTKDEADEGVEK